MKRILSQIVLLALTQTTGFGERILWTKEFVDLTKPHPRSYYVGSDGTTALGVVQPPRNEYVDLVWCDRNGDRIADNLPDPPLTEGISGEASIVLQVLYCSKDEVILHTGVSSNSDFSLYQFDGNGILEHTVLKGTKAVISPTNPLNYPYYLDYSVLEDRVVCTLYDLTSQNALNIVGDAVVGVFGRNLKVRWKTIARAKYRVQISYDGENWIDYTEIIDGNGSTMIVNVPWDVDRNELYARVLKV